MVEKEWVREDEEKKNEGVREGNGGERREKRRWKEKLLGEDEWGIKLFKLIFLLKEI